MDHLAFIEHLKAIIIRVYRGSTCSGNDFLQFVKQTRYENPQHKPRNEENQKLATRKPEISCNGCVSDDSGPHNYTLTIPIHQLENFIKTDTQNNQICVTLSNWLICSRLQIETGSQLDLNIDPKKVFKNDQPNKSFGNTTRYVGPLEVKTPICPRIEFISQRHCGLLK